MTNQLITIKTIECIIEPMYCESFEHYCEEHDIDYDFMVNDADGMHVWMQVSDYLKWYCDDVGEIGGAE